MDVSPTLHDHFKADLFDLVTCTDYDLSTTTDYWPLADLEDHRNVNNNNNNNNNTNNTNTSTTNNNNVPVGEVMAPNWTYSTYPDPSVTPVTSTGLAHKEKDTSDKMWGGGGTTEKVVNSATGNTIIITFPPTADGSRPVPDAADAAYNPSPPMTEHNNLELFNSILNEKPYEGVVSHNHRSPASDCVSYVSACSGYSDSGISTSLEDTASPNGNGHDHVDFERLVDTAVDSLVYSPGAGGLGPVEEGGLEGGYMQTQMSYPTLVTQSSDVSSILEGALRGTVRRPPGPPQNLPPLTKLSEAKTLTLMSNMTPLPPLATAFKAEQLNGVAAAAAHISSSSMYITAPYDYRPPPPPPPPEEDYGSLDASFTKLSTATSSTKIGDSSDKPKKRKYTKRAAGEEPSTKGRLLHFCHICNKGFKDKYSVNVHIRTHTGEKPFNCELCGKCFRQKAHLAKHIQIHTAPKPPGKR
ncbi:hypothetical protein Pcinc_043247 [Petrolisthes cinctipes]|uniref:C2H2-type domain-containing protein n=1 Tax=Petrolisthes cinctipes TaxID=88211 RepID=A0AAE1BH28_PETCI|nr:hypothetical protein Pcinc_043247 [Petrolisthes cinctipes]